MHLQLQIYSPYLSMLHKFTPTSRHRQHVQCVLLCSQMSILDSSQVTVRTLSSCASGREIPHQLLPFGRALLLSGRLELKIQQEIHLPISLARGDQAMFSSHHKLQPCCHQSWQYLGLIGIFECATTYEQSMFFRNS